ncbi:MAG: Flp pilus assembly complex ATPase component TadA, partial [Candidatus Eisenbacteria sp.]|nr:Flp pilus assembly complex ATPase component TadA [Candidatus Eisenbacteria bacterium]
VFSTLHTNDAPSTLNRMVDMGLEPFLVASSTNLILAQRLGRKLCTQCRERIELPPSLQENLQLADIGGPDGGEYYKAVGCAACHDTGYRGRTGFYEVMPISGTIREMIIKQSSTPEIKRQALKEGMISLRMDGLLKLKTGITSAEEVLKETAADEEA